MRHSTTHPARSMGFLSRLYDGELGEAELADFRRHVEECRECEAAASEFEQVLELYRRSEADPADPRLAERISRGIDARLRWRPPVRYVRLEIDLLWASVVIVALAGAIVTYSLVKTRSQRKETVIAERKAASPAPAFAPQPSSAPAQPSAVASEAGAQAGRLDAERSRQAKALDKTETTAAAALAAPAREKPIQLGPGITPPELVKKVEPEWPDKPMNDLQHPGVLLFDLVISRAGDVIDVKPRKLMDPRLERAVVDALRQWKYKPAMKDGKSVAVYSAVMVDIDQR